MSCQGEFWQIIRAFGLWDIGSCNGVPKLQIVWSRCEVRLPLVSFYKD